VNPQSLSVYLNEPPPLDEQSDGVVGQAAHPVTGECSLNTDLDCVRIRGAAPNGFRAAVQASSLRNGGIHRVAEKAQGVKEVTFPGAISADEDGQRLELHVAERDALLPPDPHPPEERGPGPLVEAVAVVLVRCGRHGDLPSGRMTGVCSHVHSTSTSR
jgi:hypothetical protein